MGAVLARVRAELSGHWRAWLAIALVFGAGAGGSIAAATGARRSSTAFPRFVRATGTPDLFTGGVTAGVEDEAAIFDALERLPQIKSSIRGYTPSFEVVLASGKHVGFPYLHTQVSADPRATQRGAKILEGRPLDPARADEATVSFAAPSEIRIGQTIRIPITGPEGNVLEEPSVRIVGIHASPGDFPSINGTAFPAVFLSPAFFAAHRRAIESLNPSDAIGIGITLKPGVTPDDLRAELVRRKIPIDLPVVTSEVVAGVQHSIRFEAAALWVLSALLGIAVLAIVGQALARQAHLEAEAYPTLRALGMSPRDLFTAGILRAGVVGAVAAGTAIVTGIVASAATPIGLARIAEPSPGVAIDLVVLSIGAVATLVLCIAVSAFPVFRAARSAPDTSPRRPSAVPRMLAGAGVPTSAVTGVRLALETGRGKTSVPVRSAILGTALGIAALIVAVTFADSLDRLIDTPRYSGYRWDVLIDTSEEGAPALARIIDADRSVEAFGRGGAFNFSVGGRRLLGYVWDVPSLEPVILDGRVPRGVDEIAVGPRTMRALDLRLGDTVAVRSLAECDAGCGSPEARLRIVGKTVVPGFFFEAHEPGDGVAMTLGAALRLNPSGRNGPQGSSPPFLVRFRSGVDIDAATNRISQAAGGFFSTKRQQPGDLVALANVSHAPFVLAEALALLALATMMHALLTAIRRRSRDLAILKTLGFVRGQVRATVAWQASVIAIVALALALPLGAAAGRWAWRLFADQLSVLPRPITALSTLLWLIPITLLLANLIAAIPARAAVRTRPAVVLRAE